MFRSFAIVPAAGRSDRMGTSKLLLPWGKSTVIEHVLAAWRASRVVHTVVVVPSHEGALVALCRRAGAEVVEAATQPPDMKASVLLGLNYVTNRYGPEAGDVWLIAPADIPGLTSAIIDRLLASHRPEDPRIIVPAHGQRRSHPALLPWPLAAEVSGLSNDRGVDELFTRYPILRLEVQAADIPNDLDTPDDYVNQFHRQSP